MNIGGGGGGVGGGGGGGGKGATPTYTLSKGASVATRNGQAVRPIPTLLGL